MKRSLLALLSIAFAACTSTEEVNCFDTPTSSSCVETCAETTPPGWCECIATPTRDNCETWCDQEGYDNATCRQFQMDGGTDAMDAMDAGDTSDTEVDTGPCRGGCDSGLHCNEETDECVACLNSTHCDADSQTPICDTSNNTCVGCSTTEDCRTDGGMLFCVEAGPGAGSCVECLTTENCTGDGEVCHVPGAETTQPNSDGTYACVAAPQVNVCEQCISDDQCAEGFTCAPLTYVDRSNSDMEHPEGYVCLRVAETNEPRCAAPFVRLREGVNSRNGRSVDVCVLRHSSCQAYRYYGEANGQCHGGTDMMADGDCGLEETTNDAMCEVAAGRGFRCTMRCESRDDCIAGRSCTGSGCAENSSNCYCAFD